MPVFDITTSSGPVHDSIVVGVGILLFLHNTCGLDVKHGYVVETPRKCLCLMQSFRNSLTMSTYYSHFCLCVFELLPSISRIQCSVPES